MADWIIIVLTLVIAFFTFLVWKVYERIAWLTGAMESHSDLMLRLEAKRGIKDGEPIKLVWWDPTIEKPPVKHKHGKEIDLSTIYVYLPLNERKVKPTWSERVKQLFAFP
ncbi:MAG: hypothetical protein RPV21_08320 [Candidatus Sedimenticola sp. (ex Thyasira tokunagai)]